MRKFVKTEKYGTLYVDRILFESYYPVLFSCKNDRNDVFIAVCCQNNAQGIKWMVGKTTPLAIVKMLRDEITIRELIHLRNSQSMTRTENMIANMSQRNGKKIAFTCRRKTHILWQNQVSLMMI